MVTNRDDCKNYTGKNENSCLEQFLRGIAINGKRPILYIGPHSGAIHEARVARKCPHAITDPNVATLEACNAWNDLIQDEEYGGMGACVGMRVQITKNSSHDFQMCNGLEGTICGFVFDPALVKKRQNEDDDPTFDTSLSSKGYIRIRRNAKLKGVKDRYLVEYVQPSYIQVLLPEDTQYNDTGTCLEAWKP